MAFAHPPSARRAANTGASATYCALGPGLHPGQHREQVPHGRRDQGARASARSSAAPAHALRRIAERPCPATPPRRRRGNAATWRARRSKTAGASRPLVKQARTARPGRSSACAAASRRGRRHQAGASGLLLSPPPLPRRSPHRAAVEPRLADLAPALRRGSPGSRVEQLPQLQAALAGEGSATDVVSIGSTPYSSRSGTPGRRSVFSRGFWMASTALGHRRWQAAQTLPVDAHRRRRLPIIPSATIDDHRPCLPRPSPPRHCPLDGAPLRHGGSLRGRALLRPAARQGWCEPAAGARTSARATQRDGRRAPERFLEASIAPIAAAVAHRVRGRGPGQTARLPRRRLRRGYYASSRQRRWKNRTRSRSPVDISKWAVQAVVAKRDLRTPAAGPAPIRPRLDRR